MICAEHCGADGAPVGYVWVIVTSVNTLLARDLSYSQVFVQHLAQKGLNSDQASSTAAQVTITIITSIEGVTELKYMQHDLDLSEHP